MVEHLMYMRSDAPAKESQRTGVADLIAELTVQIDNVRRIFDGSFDGSQNRRTAATSRDADVVFIDDLAHCMECSWAKQHETIGIQLDADAVAQCNLLLETSLRVLKRIETMQPRSNTPPAT